MVNYNKIMQKGKIAMSITMDELYEEGKAEGFTEGKMEEKIEIIRRMLEGNLPSETIMKLTNITKDELDNIIIQIDGENHK